MDGAADGRSSRRPLSLERIVAATLELIDEQGIGVTSMRTVGQRLGVRAMSLYRYVDNREELFDAVVDRIVNELDDDPDIASSAEAGWRPYLVSLARGVRRYARAHPHAFPLVATRPTSAPWMNPPLRSLRWIEQMLATLQREGFTDDDALFAYRSFNSFLLGFLLLETSAMALRDPLPGDGSFQSGTGPDGAALTDGDTPTDTPSDTPADGDDTVEAPGPVDPVPGGLTPARTAGERAAVSDAPDDDLFVEPLDERRYPTLNRLRAGLSAAFYEQEFAAGIGSVLDRVEARIAGGQGAPTVGD